MSAADDGGRGSRRADGRGGRAILGVGTGIVHDSSACLLVDGEVVAAAEEERFSRRKHQDGYPEEAIEWCLRRGGLEMHDVERVAVHFRPWRKLLWSCWFYLQGGVKDPGRGAYHLAREVGPKLLAAADAHRRLRMEVAPGTPIDYVDHHAAHAASAYLVSPYDEAAILTVDNRGERYSTTLSHGRGDHIRRLGGVALPHSLGVVYAAFTGRYLGFGPFDEYKVMGLAAHGRPRYLDVFRRIVRSDGGGRFWVDRGYFAFEYQGVLGRRVTRELGPARPPRAELEQRHADVAASLQERLGEIGVEVATALRRRTGARRLCLAGGVALNGVMNARIVAEAGYDDVWIQPAAGDAGCALGAALHVWTEVLGQARRSVMEHAYLGPEWSDEEVAAELRGVRAPYRHCDDIAGAVAELVADGKVVGWFQGRMEWGPRALGNRSIVADPRRPEMQERVNRCIKQRESFRPFAPAVLAARAGEWFETARASPFMLLVVPVRAERRGAIPAVTHVDGTARVQTVDERHNPRFGALLRAFERRTGVPVLLNTSFNVQGEPIVCRPIEAVRCFYGSGMDALAIGRCLVVKGEAG